MKLLNDELKIILSQLPVFRIDTFGEPESTDEIEYPVGDYWVCFKVKVKTDATKCVDYHGSYGEIPEVYTEINSREVEIYNIKIWDLDDNYIIPQDKQGLIFDDIVRPKLDIR